ncbi:MAG: glycoside hydrolase family 3 N-terminal domain-containing protein [Luteibaculaceae bacterium]
MTNQNTTTLSKIETLLAEMTLREKIGQMCQLPGVGHLTNDLVGKIRASELGSILNEVNPEVINELQRIAVEESRLGIPLVIGRDVIHGFKTVLPIPIGQAATWNEELIEKGARMSAEEASSVGVHWTFAPMIDITRDPRWGRIAESLGEDPYLTAKLGVAMVKGFQGKNLTDKTSIAACAKHFAAYGYSEAGKDYAYVNISENELRNVVLPPFKACAEAGVATFMAAFSDLNGVPATGNEFLNQQILRREWNYKGMLVSDWDSVVQLNTHGFSEGGKEAAMEAVRAGVDMEMASTTYISYLESLVTEGKITLEQIDQCVYNILSLKEKLGLFENPYVNPAEFEPCGSAKNLEIAKNTAVESCVLLKNDYHVLPLSPEKNKRIAVIGPMANDKYEQMGTWTFDGVEEWCVTPLEALKKEFEGKSEVFYAKGLSHSRSYDKSLFEEAIALAASCDTVISFMGEESILSGEAHCRADINLPGAQNDLLKEIAKLGKTTILVVMAGRPLILEETRHQVNALLYAWHPGTMGGPAIADILVGKENPSGKLPFSFPKMVGQIPVYYNQRNSGRPTTYDNFIHMNDIPVKAPQTSTGNTCFHMDAGFEPLYHFGFGLSYTSFRYQNIWLEKHKFKMNEPLWVHAEVRNEGSRGGYEVVQLYIRDQFANITRPVRELKGFKKVFFEPNETKVVSFELTEKELGFYNRNNAWMVEPGDFDVWIGGSSKAHLHTHFLLLPNE